MTSHDLMYHGTAPPVPWYSCAVLKVQLEVGAQELKRGDSGVSLRAGISERLELAGGLGRGLFLRGLLGLFPGLRFGLGLGGTRERGLRRSGGRDGLRLLLGGPRRGFGLRTGLIAFGPAAEDRGSEGSA